MRVLTTTLCYPTPEHPDQGIFVRRRARALADLAPAATRVQVVSPVPWCPLLRKAPRIADQDSPLPAWYPRMLSVPVLNWATDGVAFARVIGNAIARLHGLGRPVDLLDAHFVYPDGVGAWLAGRRYGVPVVVTVRGKIVSLSRRTIRRLQIRAMLRGVDARIAVSQSLAAWVRRVGGDDLAVDVIPNGVDPVTCHLVDRRRARSILGWRPEGRYVLAVGHMQRLKGFDRLVSIVAALRAVAGECHVVLAGSRRGETRFRRRLLRQIDACNSDEPGGAGPRVEFVGPFDGPQLNLMYNAADVLVSASRSEGWSNVISEALAAGTPVVATDVGGNAEQICSPELGTIVPDGDAGALVRAIASALARDWNRVLISAHGGARSWQQVAGQVRAVFVRVIAAREARQSGARAIDVSAAAALEGTT